MSLTPILWLSQADAGYDYSHGYQHYEYHHGGEYDQVRVLLRWRVPSGTSTITVASTIRHWCREERSVHAEVMRLTGRSLEVLCIGGHEVLLDV